MSSDWRIGTTAQAFDAATPCADAGIENLVIDRITSGLSTVTFDVASRNALTDDSTYAYGTTHILWQDGVRRFYGRVDTNPRKGTAAMERQQVSLVCPWWYIRECTYMQSWKVYNAGGSALTNVNKSRVVLFQDAAGARSTTGAQIEDVIDWLIAQGAPITKGVIDAGIELPFDEQTNLKCGDVLNIVFRWLPDYVAWFDHTTATPTFHCRRRQNLTKATVAIGSGDYPDLDITARNDLRKPGVEITYERVNTVDEVDYNSVVTDTAGDTGAIDCVRGSFDLQGSTVTFFKQRIRTEDVPDTLETAWWKARVAWLNPIDDSDITLHDLDTSECVYPRILLDGMIQDWMSKDEAEVYVRAQVDYVVRDNLTNIVHQVKNQDVAVLVRNTNAATLTYSRLASFESGEATPTGVAAALYDAWSILHYEGALDTTAVECSGAVLPGHVLNVTGGRSEWTTMDALVQEVREDIDSGHTTVSFGPPRRIEADTLVALFRNFRTRRFSWQRNSRTTGAAAGAGEIEISGAASPSRSESSGAGETTKLRLKDVNEHGTHTIEADPTLVEYAEQGDKADRSLQPREVVVVTLDESGAPQLQRMQAMCTPAYHAATPFPALPTGTGLGQLPHWDQTTAAWVLSAVGALNDGDMIKWDATNSRYTQVTPIYAEVVADVRWNTTDFKLEKLIDKLLVIGKDPEASAALKPSTWSDVTNGDGVGHSTL